MNAWWRQWFKTAGLMFLAIALTSTVVHGIVFGPWGASVLIGCILGAVSSLGLSFYLVRELKRETLEINTNNKDKQKGLQWYYDEILHYLHSSRYRELTQVDDVRVFEPPMLLQHMGGKVELKRDSYSISITGPRGVVRIIGSILDIQKIFL